MFDKTFWILVIIFVAFYFVFMRDKLKEKIKETNRIAAMSPDERKACLVVKQLGPVNEHLICPHCQAKGKVHAKNVSRVITSTGKVGGILKTNTKSSTAINKTQHYCDQCGTTWDV